MLKLLFLTRKDFCREDTEGMAEFIGNGCKSVDNKAMKEKDFNNVDLVIRYGCTATVPVKKVLNKAHAIHAVFDKPGFRVLLQKLGLCPKTWFSLKEFLKDIKGKYKVIVRPKTHYAGKAMYLCDSIPKLEQAIEKCGEGYYISEYINKVAEYRVHILQGRVISVEEKVNENPRKIAWNFAPHVYVRWSKWNEEVIKSSIKAMEISGLDFGGVDVILDDKGKAYVLEVNSAPHAPLRGDGTLSYHQTCFAKGFKWLAEHGRDHIPPGNKGEFYMRYIHPAICPDVKI